MRDEVSYAISVTEEAAALSTEEKVELLHSLCSQIPSDRRREAVLAAVKGMEVEDRKTVARGAVQALPKQERKEVTIEMAAGYFPPPDTTTRDKIWMIIIGSFAFVLVVGFLALAAGMFLPPANGGVQPALILSMFMSAVGFIGGLFVPSPASSRGFGTDQSSNGG